MLARMKTLEEGFAEVVRELRESRESRGGSAATTVVDVDERRRDKKGKGVARIRPDTSSGGGNSRTMNTDYVNTEKTAQAKPIGDSLEKGSSM